MPLILNDLDTRVRLAVKAFWSAQKAALKAKRRSKRKDTGRRGALTSGQHLAAFAQLISKIVAENGLPESDIRTRGDEVTIPGYFRATKSWDLLIVHRGLLVAAVELKSMGSSFGNNLNNRAEEILGQSLDFLKAHERRIFRDSPKPFLGYCVLLADEPGAHRKVGASSPHFAVLPEFDGASYAQRFAILCQKMVEEELYSEACVLLTPPVAGSTDGAYSHLDESTSFKRFAAGLAAHVAKIAANQK
ncbi:MAG TPA: PaeR7I family type II restriction endonuclease [Opitutaceae bacterium]|nr:PaeR7I family type II restriction endonuclease [Opitutaceae bacterium]